MEVYLWRYQRTVAALPQEGQMLNHEVLTMLQNEQLGLLVGQIGLKYSLLACT